MKFFRLYSLALAGALMLGACSSSDDLKDGGANVNDKAYLAIRIKEIESYPLNMVLIFCTILIITSCGT